jgi:hypothetical protein
MPVLAYYDTVLVTGPSSKTPGIQLNPKTLDTVHSHGLISASYNVATGQWSNLTAAPITLLVDVEVTMMSQNWYIYFIDQSPIPSEQIVWENSITMPLEFRTFTFTHAFVLRAGHTMVINVGSSIATTIKSTIQVTQLDYLLGVTGPDGPPGYIGPPGPPGTAVNTGATGPQGVQTNPGGSNSQVQYNHNGAFAGSPNLVFDGNFLLSPKFLAWTENSNAVTITDSTYTFNCKTTNTLVLTLNASTAISFTNVPISALSYGLNIWLKQGSGGPMTITWPTSVKWPGGSAPPLSSAEGAMDAVRLTTFNGGGNWYGYILGQNFM